MKESFEPKKDSQKNTTPENKKGAMANIRKAFLAGAVTLSSMFPPVEAQKNSGVLLATNAEAKIGPKIENVTAVPKGDAKALEIGISSPSDTFEIKIANYYETDKAEISTENREQISETLSGYLLGLSHENVEAFLKNDVVLRISCDPRHTNFTGLDGKAGNFYLAQARGVTAEEVIKNIVLHFTFEKTDLTPSEITRVKEKFNHIIVEIPLTQTETKQGEDGVVDYHKVINPDTNKPYTDADWVELHKPGNEEKKLKAYENFRYANLSLVIPNIHTTETIPPSEKPPFDLDGYEKAYVLFDDSPSMRDWRKVIADTLKENKIDIPIEVSGFTSKTDTTFYAKNITEAAEALSNLNLVEDPDEFAFDVAITKLQAINEAGNKDSALKQQKKIMTVSTDESLQRVSQDKLDTFKKLAMANNMTIKFPMLVRIWDRQTAQESKVVHTFSVTDIERAYKDIYKKEKREERVKNTEKQIEITNKWLRKSYDALGTVNNQKEKKQIMKDIASQSEDLENLKKNLENAKTINIDELALNGIKVQSETFSGKPDKEEQEFEITVNDVKDSLETLADISAESLQKISENTTEFLLSFNKDNFDELIDSMSVNLNFKYTNSDSENFATKETRAQNIKTEIRNTIRNAVDHTDWSKTNLTQVQIEQIIKKYKKLLEEPKSITVVNR